LNVRSGTVKYGNFFLIRTVYICLELFVQSIRYHTTHTDCTFISQV